MSPAMPRMIPTSPANGVDSACSRQRAFTRFDLRITMHGPPTKM
jgi:hypothetical protein